MTTKRLIILNNAEIKFYYEPKNFDSDEQQHYFTLDNHEENIVNGIGSTTSKVYFILLLGYFKASRQLFNLETVKNISANFLFVKSKYFPSYKKKIKLNISRPTRLELEYKILKLFDYKVCDLSIKKQIEVFVAEMVSIDNDPVFIFKEVVRYLHKNRVILPGYTVLQDIIGKAITAEEKRLTLLLNKLVKQDIHKKLEKLLEANNSLHEITYLKRELKSFGYKEMQAEIVKLRQIKELYYVSKEFLPQLNISNSSIKYYASLVDYYNVYKLKRMNKKKALIYLICFIHYRFKKMNDNLIDCFIHYVDWYLHEADKYAKTFVAQQQIIQTAQFKKAASIFEMFYDNQYDEFAFSKIKDIAYKILPVDEFKAFTEYLNDQKFDLAALEWSYYVQIAGRIKKNLRPLLLSLDFKGNNNSANLIQAYDFVQQKLTVYKTLMKVKPSEFPVTAIVKSVYPYLCNEVSNTKVINCDKYEFWLYQQLSHNCGAGHVFVNDSNKYRNFDDDLVDDVCWQDKENIIKNLGYKKLIAPLSETLDELEKELEYWIVRVNTRFDAGENPHIKLSGKKLGNTWSLPYAKLDEPDNHYIFKDLPRIAIADILIENHKYCSLLECFTPLVNRYNKSELQTSSLLASIIAMGTFIGLGEMGKISDISYNSLASTTHNRIRLETLRAANDKASNEIAKLPISKHHNILEEFIHASADGTKIETILDTFNSRCSPKYFGVNKGVSALTLVVNHIAANVKLLGAHEYEGNFIFDLLFNNTSDIDPDILSTDTHGTNAVNFIILYFFDYIFAPRYKDTAGKIDGHIYGFKSKEEYSKYKIKPTKKVNKQLILDEEDNIKKIMVSLATKATTQGVIISKLSSHKRRNRTKYALCELDNIIRSIHLLRYVDDITYRLNIQKALNRGESYNKLRRAISYANEGKLNVHSEMSQQIYNECTRFIANNIILYNARLLSNLLIKLEKAGKIDEIEKLKRISPIAWAHINIYGRYEFNKEFLNMEFNELIKLMSLDNIKFEEN